MDWGNVTNGELLSSLQEVDWTQPPRPPSEFAAKFSAPGSQKKLETRLKCNTYYYRANYLLILVAALVIAFFRKPSTFFALAFALLGALCMNNTFATSLSNRILKIIRKIHSPTAQKLRFYSGGHNGLGAPGSSKLEVKVVGIPQRALTGALVGLALILLFRRGALLTLLISLLSGVAVVVLHASFRVPNLKTRLASARDDFRAVWRGYQQNEHDLIA